MRVDYEMYAGNTKTKYVAIRTASEAGQYITLYDELPKNLGSSPYYDVIRVQEMFIYDGVLTIRGQLQTLVPTYKMDGWDKKPLTIDEVAERDGVGKDRLMEFSVLKDEDIYEKVLGIFKRKTGETRKAFKKWNTLNGEETPITEVYSNFTISDENEVLNWGRKER